MALNVLNYFINCCERKAYAGICTAIVDSDPACICVAKCSAGEGNVLNVADCFVDLTGVDKVFSAAVLDLPGLVYIKYAGGEAVYKAVAAL